MNRIATMLRIGAFLCALPIAIACGNESTDAWDSPDRIEECSLLTDAEVTAAIGPHGAPEMDMLFGGCAWHAQVPPTENGFRPGVVVAVVPAVAYEQVAHVGEPVDGFGAGATYDSTWGELWFRCRGDMHCGLKIDISDPDERAATARRLGLLVKSRA